MFIRFIYIISFVCVWLVVSSGLNAQVEWEKYANNPVLDVGAPGSWDDLAVFTPTVLFINGEYKMWYSANDGDRFRVGYATSPDGIAWTKADSINPVFDVGAPGRWDDYGVYANSIIYDGNIYKMWYSGFNAQGEQHFQIGYATSSDGINWTKADSINPILTFGAPGSWDDNDVIDPSVIFDGQIYHMWYTGGNDAVFRGFQIGYATSTDGLNWVKADSVNPVLTIGNPGSWDEDGVGLQFVRFDENMNKYQMWFFGKISGVNRGRIGYATSADGITWTKAASQNPVLDYGNTGEWDDLYVVYPTILVVGNTYKMWYSGAGTTNFDKIGYATSTPPQQSVTFTKITTGAIVTDGGESEACSWGDYDNDGDQDLFVSNGLLNSRNNFLYRNDGPASGYTFTKITDGNIVNDGGGSRSASWGDYDNDGDIDLFVANQQVIIKDFLYQNNGDGTFTKITEGDIVNDNGVADPATWVDFDNDGFLDVFVGNPGGDGRNFLYHSNRDGTFTKITQGEIVTDSEDTIGHGWGDFDNDGDRDLFVGNRAGFNSFYLNNGDNSFTKMTEGIIITDPGEASGANWIDYDNDRDLDLFVSVSGLDQTNDFYLNEGPDSNYTFTKITGGDIVTDISNFSSSSWADFDNDGDLDCFISNFGDFNFNGQANYLYFNNGDGTFTKITEGDIVSDVSTSVGCAVADYDNDGDMDLYVCNTFDSNNLLYRNDNNNGNSWLKIQLIGTASNASGIGARINVKATLSGAEVWQMRVIEGQSGLLGQNSLIAHFGLGSASNIDSLKIEWPSGIIQVLENQSVNQLLTVTEDTVTTGNGMIVFTKITDGPIPDSSGWGQGASWADYDGDGDEDLLVINGNNTTPPHVNFLYENNGDGSFTKIASGEIATDLSYYLGTSWGDYDGDGDLDLFLACGFDQNNQNVVSRLFRNDGGGNFTRILTGEPVTDSNFGRSANWVDYDNDSDLDLFVVTAGNTGSLNFLYKNDGFGNFTRVTTGLLVTDGAFAQGVAWSDFDQDGDMDVCLGVNSDLRLYENTGNDTWNRIILFTGDIVIPAWGDYDNDGWLDLFAANGNLNGLPTTNNLLFHNEGDGTLQQVTTGPVVTDPIPQNTSGVWADFDNDGDLDLYTSSTGDHSYLYINEGSGNFVLDTTSIFYNNNSLYASTADYDIDGDMDIVTVRAEFGNVTYPDYLYRNDSENTNNWLKVHLKGTASNTTGIGAKIRIRARINDQEVWQTREIAQQQGAGNQNSLIAHFGLGTATLIDSLKIEWPSGIIQTGENIAVNQLLTVIEDTVITGIDDEPRNIPSRITLAQNYPNPFNPETVINYQLPANSNVKLTIYNTLGQKVRTLVNTQQAACEWSITWKGVDDAGNSVSSGIYVYRLDAGGQTVSRKMLLLK